MLYATQHKSIDAAVKYFKTVLSQGDYYLGTEIDAFWHGLTAKLLGLETGKAVTRKQFEALLSGKHPKTGQKLAQRMRSDRRPETDLTFSVPKSVSLAWAINGDDRILDVLRQAVHETVSEDIEPLVHRRVRTGKSVNTDNRKHTGNLVYADFLHKTSRPVDGTPDPHLHVHTFLVNLTADENRYYAADFTELMRQVPSLQAKFDSRLARKLQHELGYAVERVTFKQSGRLKQGWELCGVERGTIEKFSRRTEQIEAHADQANITDAEEKAQLGRKTREAKDGNLAVEQLRKVWGERLSPMEREAFAALQAGAVGKKGNGETEAASLQAAVDFALKHHLERQSTVESHRIVGTALEHGVTLRQSDIEARLEELNVLARSVQIDGASREFLTTPEVLAAEQSMLAFARDGRGTRYALGPTDHVFHRDWLNDQQKAAVNQVCRSRDTVTVVIGGAGTGKTSLMKETAEAIERKGKSVFTFAPTSGARDVLQGEGFTGAETVEHLLRNEKLRGDINAGDALWIDEAGLLDVRSMNGIFQIADQRQARVVLSGDTRQHSSPRRGEALRLLQAGANLDAARVDKIQRQKHQYKRAVELISRGDEIVDPNKRLTGLAAGFDLLDKLGKIQEIKADQRHEVLASHYMRAIQRGKSTLVVSPTHAEGKCVTQEIRTLLREAGAIGSENREREFASLRSLNLTEAQKGDFSSYTATGQVIQFHQNTKGFQRGQRFYVRRSSKSEVVLVPMQGKGEAKPLPFAAADRFDVYAEDTVRFAKGDKVRFSLGGTSKDGKRRIANGRLDEIAGFDRGGNVRMKSGMVVDRNFAHWDLGYCVTSHASQGKTTDVMLAAMGAQSLPAINQKQFYVTASRASEDLAIFVDDKEAIRRAIHESGQQVSATELMQQSVSQDREPKRKLPQQRKAVWDRIRLWWQTHRPGHVAGQSPQTSSDVGVTLTPKLSR